MIAERNWNILTLGLYQWTMDVRYPMKAIVTERYDDSLINADQRIYVYRRDDFVISLTVYDDAMQPIDISNSTFTFTVREMKYDRPGKILIKKTLGEGIEFIDAANGILGIEFHSEDTENMSPDLHYKYTLEMFN